jgi:ABC-2 type transport system permease protein
MPEPSSSPSSVPPPRPRSPQARERRLYPIVELTLGRMREFLREPEAVFWVFAFPVLMALALGIAFRSQKPQEVVAGVVMEQVSAGAAATAPDASATAAAATNVPANPAAGGVAPSMTAQQVVQALQSAGGIRVRTLTAAEADAALRNGLVSVVIVPGAAPGYRYDPTRPESHLGRLTVDAALQRAAGRRDVWTPRDDQVVAVGSRYIDWLLPGLLGMNIMGTGFWSVGFSVVTARSRKLLKRLVATPMPRSSYLLSHMLARIGFLVLEVAVLLLFGYFAFGVRIQGSILAVATLCLIGAASFSGLGLLMASRARTIEAVSGLMNVTMLPMWLLSGVFFASSNFPDIAQPFIQILPLTVLNNALRGVMIEARPLTALTREIAILGGWGLASFALAIKLFRWR